MVKRGGIHLAFVVYKSQCAVFTMCLLRENEICTALLYFLYGLW